MLAHLEFLILFDNLFDNLIGNFNHVIVAPYPLRKFKTVHDTDIHARMHPSLVQVSEALPDSWMSCMIC